MKSLKKILALTAIVAASFMSTVQAQDAKKITFQSNFNSIEASVNLPSGISHVRSVNSLGMNIGPVALTYNGLNEVDLNAMETYYGEHTPTIGYTGMPIEGTVKFETTTKGTDFKYGLNLPLPKSSGLYGNASITANKQGIDWIVLAGKDIPNTGIGIELYNKLMLTRESVQNYSEIQVTKNMGKVDLLGRIAFENKTPIQGNVGLRVVF